MIITGAPVELMPFEEVDYWPELVEIMNWGEEHVYSTFYICWGAQAGLYHHFGINKCIMDENYLVCMKMISTMIDQYSYVASMKNSGCHTPVTRQFPCNKLRKTAI